MAETKTDRKVTVILATDVVGYSVKMEENEGQTSDTFHGAYTLLSNRRRTRTYSGIAQYKKYFIETSN